VRGREIALERGQLSYSVRFLAAKWGWTKARVEGFLKRLKRAEIIRTVSRQSLGQPSGEGSDSHASGQMVITICNYAKYQDANSARGETLGQPSGEGSDSRSDEIQTKNNNRTSKYIYGTISGVSEVDADFEKFWSAYPKRAGQNPKKPARHMFAKLVRGGVDPNDIIDGAKKYAKQMAGERKFNTEFVAQAKTWLNQERWKDDDSASAVDPIEAVWMA